MLDISRLFDRYVQAHLDVSLDGQPILNPEGDILGYAEIIRLRQQQVHVTGWAQVDDLTLRQGNQIDCVAPSIHRSDVNAARGCAESDTLGFAASLPLGTGPLWLTARVGDHRLSTQIADISGADMATHRSALRRSFLWALLQATPSALKWAITRAPRDRTAIKRGLGLDASPTHSKVCDTLFAETAAESPNEAGVTIVLPIFNAFELLPEVLNRVLENTDLDWRLIAVEDCSTDRNVRPYLRKWLTSQPKDIASRITLVENEKNLGFIRSVNRALKLALRHDDHVVLLNSDALVPLGWASRLLRPILDRPEVATVTPMSNDAEIFTIPAICTRTALEPGEADRIDLTAQTLHPAGTLAHTPTGVGFCMAMNRAFLRKLPRLDTVFGRGYGEEVDWCQKARALGGEHVALPSLFVEHRGGASFGSDAKRKLIETNNRRISQRYPDYDAEVQAFIQADPIAPARLALAVSFAAGRQSGALPIYLGHVMGGGAEDDLLRRIKRDLKRDHAAIVLRVGGGQNWQLDLHGPWGTTRAQFRQFDDVARVLAPVRDRRVIYSCAVGAAHPLQLPEQLLALGKDGVFQMLVHDYFTISPSYTLLDSDGIYRGVPSKSTDDRSHSWGPVSLDQWQNSWRMFIEQCTEIEVFSKDSADIFAEVYPEAAGQIVVRPHKLISEVSPVDPRNGPRTIGVLGNIGFQKGADVLSHLSVDLALKGDTSLVVIGNVDPTYPLHPSVRVHGSYDRKDIAGLARDYGVTDWLIPSIWPETFSFTTHEALATGLPVWCFDIGAQAEAVRNGANGGGVILLSAESDASTAIVKALFDSRETEAA